MGPADDRVDPCARTALCEPFTAIRDSAVSGPWRLVSVNVAPFRNIEGQPMTSTSRNPMSARYRAVNSPRTPMEALRSRTAATNCRTVCSIGFSRPAS